MVKASTPDAGPTRQQGKARQNRGYKVLVLYVRAFLAVDNINRTLWYQTPKPDESKFSSKCHPRGLFYKFLLPSFVWFVWLRVFSIKMMDDKGARCQYVSRCVCGSHVSSMGRDEVVWALSTIEKIAFLRGRETKNSNFLGNNSRVREFRGSGFPTTWSSRCLGRGERKHESVDHLSRLAFW